jgi:regulator of nucleoside diphosphate kinase
MSLRKRRAPIGRAGWRGGLPVRTCTEGKSMDHDRMIFVTDDDFERLTRLLEQRQGSARDGELRAALDEELGRARIVAATAIPPDVVTMNSDVRFEDVETGERFEARLVYPEQADVDRGQISVLAPVGSALLGLSVGQSIRWPLPRGGTRHLRVVAVTYQPEAAGDATS